MDRAAVATFIVLLLVLGAWFYGPWQTLCVDWARERMFEARNAIFDMAASGDLEFSSPEYRKIRRRIEGTIRFSHRISWPTIVLLYFGFRNVMAQRPQASMSELVGRLPNEALQTRVRRHTDAVAWAMIRLIVFRSAPLLIVFLVVLLLVRLGVPFYRACKLFAERIVESIQMDAITVEEEEAAFASPRGVITT